MTANKRGPAAALFLMAAVGVMGGWAAIGQERAPALEANALGEKIDLARPEAAFDASTDALKLDAGLESDVRQMLQEYAAESSEAVKAELQVRLKDAASKQFDLRQRTRQAELDKLDQELKRLRAIHERREESKDAIVETRLRQLIDAAEGLGWDVSGSDAVSGSNQLLDPFGEGDFVPGGRRSAAPSAAGPLAAPPAATVPRVGY